MALISPFYAVFLSLLFSLHLAHHPQEVSAPYLGDVCFGESVFQQADGDVDKIVVAVAAFHATAAVEVGADAYMVYARYFNHVQQVVHKVAEVGALGIRVQELVYQAGLCHAAVCGKGAQLVVGQVAVVLVDGACRRVGCDDGLLRILQCIPKGAFGGMGEVDHDAQAVHLFYRFTAEGADAFPADSTVGRTVANVIISGMAEGDVSDAQVVETGYVLQVLSDAVAVLYSDVECFSAFGFQPRQVVGGAGNGAQVGVHLYLAVDALYQFVYAGYGFSAAFFIARALAYPAGKVLSVQSAFFHFGDTDLGLRARTYIIGVVKVERGVCMRVYGQNALVYFPGFPVSVRLTDQEVEEACRYAVARYRQGFGMELYAPYGIFPGGLDGFGDAVCRPSRNLEAGSGLLYCLVVMGVGEKLCPAYDGSHCGAGLKVHHVGGYAARFVLVVADGGVGMLGRNVLVERPAECDVNQLFAPADAQHRQVAVGGKADEGNVIDIAQGVHFAQLLYGIFVEVRGVYVTATYQDNAVEALDNVRQHQAVGGNGYEHRSAPGADYGFGVRHPGR